MELKKGYKQTEVGVIPEDWVITSLNNLIDENRSIRYGIVQPGNYDNEGRYMVRGQDYSFGWADPIELFRVSPQIEEKYKNARLKCGDIILTIVGAGTGHLEVVPEWLDGANITQTTARIAIDKNKAISKYCKYYFQSSAGKNQINIYIKGAAQPGLNIRDVKIFQIPLPPNKGEQTSIATALSDMDDLINSLSTLIEKKKAIKQGAMQELLKPKEGWERKSLKELAKYRRGSFPQPYGLDKWYDDISGSPFVQVYDVDDNFKLKEETKRRISDEAKAMSVFIEKGSIIITLQGSIGRIAITQYDAYVDRTLLFFESFIVPFNMYFFALSVFLLFEKEKEIAPGGIIKTITKEALSSFTIAYPSIEEQDRIAFIFLDIENEIISLEQNLSKYQMLKQGIMQELLTGKTRLV